MTKQELRRKSAVEEYYKHPNLCRECGRVIQVPDEAKLYAIRIKKFCDSRCAAKTNGRIFVKRERLRHCKHCKSSNVEEGRRICRECRDSGLTDTLLTLMNRPWMQGKHPSWRFTEVRRLTRIRNKYRQKICQNCAYSKHIEYAHIKPLSSFPLDTVIGDITSPENVFVLCPNCHWEFDNGELSKEQIQSRTGLAS